MGKKYKQWDNRSGELLSGEGLLAGLILKNRRFNPVGKLNYGDFGLNAAANSIIKAVNSNQKIGLYADYDVDGTMSCLSWIWFLQEIGYKNFIHYIPCRFREGYGVNLEATKHLIHNENVSLIITMDTGITANVEAEYSQSQGVDFICTDHHKIQPDKMPNCIIVNPKLNPDKEYQELCGAGITFVLLRTLARNMSISLRDEFWGDLMAICALATVCDLVPLTGVNHKLVKQGLEALAKSKRAIFRELRKSVLTEDRPLDESDLGFRIGPRINAAGRLSHADLIIESFTSEDPFASVTRMTELNNRRKSLGETVTKEALSLAEKFAADRIIFVGSETWHAGVLGISASRLVENFYKPTWLFHYEGDLAKGSARSIDGFDVTEAMMESCRSLFIKFGGHAAAGGFTFYKKDEEKIRIALNLYANQKDPEIWQSKISYDCELALPLLSTSLLNQIEPLRPFGRGFEPPLFAVTAKIKNVTFYRDKHTAVTLENGMKVMFFNEVHSELKNGVNARFLTEISSNIYNGKHSLNLFAKDFELI